MENNQATIHSPFLVSFSERSYKTLKGFLFLFYLVMVFSFLFSSAHPYSIFGAITIATAAIIPVILWLEAPVQTIPILPSYTMPFLWYYSIPLVTQHPALEAYTPRQHLAASFWIALFALIPTVIWWLAMKGKTWKPKTCHCLSFKKVESLLLVSVFLVAFFWLAIIGNWFHFSYSLFTILRTSIFILSTISYFLLGYLFGANQLTAGKKIFFIACLLTANFAIATGLVLVIPVTQMLVTIIGFTLGKRKPPIILSLVLLSMFVMLHFGKFEMRHNYWSNTGERLSSVTQIPSFYAEWYGYSISHIFSGGQSNDNLYQAMDSEINSRSFLERICLISQFLEVYTRTGKDVDYLSGSTYAVIFQSLVPRFLNPNKTAAHEAGRLMNQAYRGDLQGASDLTHVAWGVLAEAWANYSVYGCIGISVLIGLFIAVLSRLCADLPLTSFYNCLAICALPILFEGESTLAVKTVSFFHAVVVLTILSFFYSEKVYLQPQET